MSVRRRRRTDGHDVWQVLWRDPDGRQRSETKLTRREAERRDREIRDLRWQGKIDAVDAGRESLRDATDRWWSEHAEPDLARSTLRSYAQILDCHLLPRLGDVPIRDIDPATVITLQRDLAVDGVGGPTVHRTLMILSSIMRHAVVCGRIPSNPVSPVRIKRPRRKRAIRPLAPVVVERLRAAMLARDDQASAVLVCLMAYAGLRPGEATGLAWEHVGTRTLLVERSSTDDGDHGTTKTAVIRTVRLLEPLAADLESWRAAQTKPFPTDLIVPRHDGRGWKLDDYKNWRRRHFDPALDTAGLERTRPYDLRHSFASLMIQGGYSPVELAAELGHAPTLTLDTYSHVFSEFARGKRIDPEAEIWRARTSTNDATAA
jgi:integrase